MAEKEYIERDAVLAEIEEVFGETDPTGDEQIGLLKGHRILRMHPAADVAPVVHAEWQQYDAKYCSRCGAGAPFLSLAFKQICTPYCHNCGAKMDGERYAKKTD